MSEKAKRKNSYREEHRTDKIKCPICGSQYFVRGKLQHTWFVPNKASFGKRMAASMKGNVEARQCTSCGNVQLFDDVE
jgi:predicted RNA-binding Zn-ribbon protein involved in translation (DUF1610 family)